MHEEEFEQKLQKRNNHLHICTGYSGRTEMMEMKEEN